MSRHALRPKSRQWVVTVGWDNPLQTFFAYVSAENPNDDDEPLLWLGADYGEVKRPENMVVPLEPFAELSGEMIIMLKLDREKLLDRGPSQLQRENLRMFGTCRAD